jgi:hypothetical protein
MEGQWHGFVQIMGLCKTERRGWMRDIQTMTVKDRLKLAEMFKEEPVANGFITKDSGKREEFGSGAVRDVREGKGRYDLFSPIAIRRLAGVYERGARKYSDRNWEAGIPISRCLDSALRHTFQYLSGEKDEDHLAQACWNLMACMHFEELKPELNDLPWGKK